MNPLRRLGPLFLLLAVVAAGVVAYARGVDVPGLLRQTLETIAGLGPWGAVLFVLLYIMASVLLLPGAVLTLGAGAVFGVVRGSIIVSIAATLGATAAFLVGRYFARAWVSRQIEHHARFRAIDEAVAREGWKIVGLMRMSPAFPFNVLNYVFGVTRIPLRDYVLASWIGMMPGTVLYVYVGSLAGDLAALGAGDRARTPVEWTASVLGLLATIAVTLYVTRLARTALQRRIEPAGAERA